MARITAFSPGQSPPPVSTPTRMSSLLDLRPSPAVSTLAPRHTFAWRGSRRLPVLGSVIPGELLLVRLLQVVEGGDEAVADRANQHLPVPQQLDGRQHDVEPGHRQ